MKVQLKNLGTTNKNLVVLEDVKLWVSYETVVAFQKGNEPIVACENIWSKTTGKLLNELEPDHNKRIKRDQFEELLTQISIEVEQ